MADPELPQVNLKELHEKIAAFLKDFNPGWAVYYYDRPGEKVPVPCVSFELESIEPDNPDSLGTEQWSCILRFSAYIITTYKSAGKMQVRTLALALAGAINQRKFGCPVGCAEVQGVTQDQFREKENSYNVMRIDWEHKALVGDSVWASEEGAEPPEQVFVSSVPFIGNAFGSDYQPVTEPKNNEPASP